MTPDVLTIHTLGTFSVQLGGEIISDSSKRSQKIWQIFKYLITCRNKVVTTEALIEALWPDDVPDDPLKLLYTHMSRLRRQLRKNGSSEDYILYRQKGYQWNPEAVFYLDTAAFEKLIHQARKLITDEEKLPLLKEAISLYAGNYIEDSAFEIWIQPLNSYYKNMYLRAVNELADIYARAAAQDEIITLCTAAILIEPYSEPLYERLIRALMINGETGQAQEQYRHITELMKKEFGAQPSDELLQLDAEMRGISGEETDLNLIKRRLEAGDSRRGAYFCTSDIFKQIYLTDKRSDERINFPVFLGLVTIAEKEGSPLGEKTMSQAMRTLRQCLSHTLRTGDIVAQYSKSQFLVLLSAYLPRDANTALERIRRSFEAEYPAKLCELRTNLSQIGSGRASTA